MKQKLPTLLVLAQFFIFTSVIAQNKIILQHGNTVTFENYLDSAVIHAQDGDYIYLPAGIVKNSPQNNTQLQIDKSLKIIGCGYHRDSSATTGITIVQHPAISFYGGNSVVTGCVFTGLIVVNSYDSYVSNIVFERNFFKASTSFSNTNNGTIIVKENVFFNSVGTSFTNCTVVNNILPYVAISNSSTLKNNVFLYFNTPASNIIHSHSIIENNIFLLNSSTLQQNLLNFNDCFLGTNLFSVDSVDFYNYIPTGINSNAIFDTPNNIFTNYSLTHLWSERKDLGLKPTCVGNNAGSDGTDVGIYGGNTPFKNGGRPFNPQFTGATIPPYTIGAGLNINLNVKAQDN